MLFDGTRGLIKGDYLRPHSGKHAGQLGPWSKIVSAVGIDPESTLMKRIFVVLGLAGLVCAAGLAMNYGWAWEGLMILSLASIWYLVPGTILNILQIIILILIRKNYL